MAIARDTTAANIKVPNKACIIKKYTAGSTIAAGELVSMSSDGYIDPSDSTSAKNPVLGVAIAGAASGFPVDVVLFGEVICLTGATPGAVVYNSTTAGEPSESVAGNQTVAGIAVSATTLFVRPAST